LLQHLLQDLEHYAHKRTMFQAIHVCSVGGMLVQLCSQQSHRQFTVDAPAGILHCHQ
jgi:hypothetical protein